jgi:hypothetical protein
MPGLAQVPSIGYRRLELEQYDKVMNTYLKCVSEIRSDGASMQKSHAIDS